MEELGRTVLGSGLKPDQLDLAQVALRAVLIYVATLAIVRLGKKRFMGRGSAFDVIVGIVVGSIAGRAITGNAPLGTAIAGIAVLLAMHWLFSAVATRWHGFGVLIKGQSRLLVRDGKLDEAALRAEHLTCADLDEDLRGKGRAGLDGVREGRIERDGKLSLLTRTEPPKVVDVTVRDGVQTVRIQLG